MTKEDILLPHIIVQEIDKYSYLTKEEEKTLTEKIKKYSKSQAIEFAEFCVKKSMSASCPTGGEWLWNLYDKKEGEYPQITSNLFELFQQSK